MNRSDGTIPTPPLERLDDDGIDAIDAASMHILEEIGIKVSHDDALEVLAAHGAEVDDELVRIDEDLVREAVELAPSSFTLYDRAGDSVLAIGEGDVLRAPGYGSPNLVTFDEGRRQSTLDDYERLVKLAHLEDVINCTGYNVCEPNDVDQSVKHLEMVKRSLLLSDQPLMASTYGEARAAECLEMIAIATGDEDLSRPYALGLINTVPPRSLDTRMVGGLMTYAAAGQPPIVSSFTMAGASGPATLAGSLAQANAENLLGITIAQLVNPGTPVVYGVPSSNIDIRYGSLSIGSAESALFVSFAGQMGRFYDLPTRAGGALCDAKTVDYQAGFESMLVLATTAFADIDVVLHAAGILESYSAISPEKFVLDCEALRYLERFERGYAIDDDSFALDVMETVEPTGHYLSQRHTLDHAESSFYRPDISDKRSHGDWAEDGGQSAFEAAHRRVESLLETYTRPPIEPELADAIEAYAADAIAARG